MRVHVGCGYIYLRPSVLDDPRTGWLNVECREADAVLAPLAPDRVEALQASDEDYYRAFQAVTQESLAAGPKPQDGPPVCDAYGDAMGLPVGDLQADELLLRQVFEHLSIREARRALTEFHRVLRPGGVLRIDVPDHDGTVRKIREDGDPFWARHLLGTKRNDVAYHVMSYSRESLTRLVEEHGFDRQAEEPNVHFYPAFCLRFTKPPIDRQPWEYNLAGIEVPAGRKLDVGCGPAPWPAADVVADRDQRVLAGRPRAVRADVQFLPFKTGSFAFSYASHVLEHVPDPVRAAAELSRVSGAGVVECPSVFKDALFNFHEADHRWHALPGGPAGVLELRPLDRGLLDQLADRDLQGVLHRLWRLGPPRLEHDSLVARRWYQRREPLLNVIVRWAGRLGVKLG